LREDPVARDAEAPLPCALPRLARRAREQRARQPEGRGDGLPRPVPWPRYRPVAGAPLMNLPNEDEVRSIVRQMLQQMAANGKPCMVSGVFGPPDEIKNKDYRNSF